MSILTWNNIVITIMLPKYIKLHALTGNSKQDVNRSDRFQCERKLIQLLQCNIIHKKRTLIMLYIFGAHQYLYNIH
jgi:hemerythrin superfamily protein